MSILTDLQYICKMHILDRKATYIFTTLKNAMLLNAYQVMSILFSYKRHCTGIQYFG